MGKEALAEHTAREEYNALLKSGQLGAADDLISQEIAAGGRAEALFREWVRVCVTSESAEDCQGTAIQGGSAFSAIELVAGTSTGTPACSGVPRGTRGTGTLATAPDKPTSSIRNLPNSSVSWCRVRSMLAGLPGVTKPDRSFPMRHWQSISTGTKSAGSSLRRSSADSLRPCGAFPACRAGIFRTWRWGRLGRRVSSELKGTLGCFLGHVAAWEAFLATEHQAVLVVEDDTTFRFDLPKSVTAFGVPENYDYCFITAGIAAPIRARPGAASEFVAVPVDQAIKTLWSTVRVPGTQGYLLSRPGAEALLRRTEEDGFFGDIDWRLVAYSFERKLLGSLPQSTFAHEALTAQFDVIASHPPMRGFALSPGFAFPGAWSSVRVAANRSKSHAHLM